MTTKTNIKNLPEGKYFTEIGWSQSYPWVAIKRTDKTVTLAAVRVDKDPAFTPHIIPGGFAGHCDNQNEQTWLYKGIDQRNTKTIRLTKKGWTHKGVRFWEDVAREFYDWNF